MLGMAWPVMFARVLAILTTSTVRKCDVAMAAAASVRSAVNTPVSRHIPTASLSKVRLGRVSPKRPHGWHGRAKWGVAEYVWLSYSNSNPNHNPTPNPNPNPDPNFDPNPNPNPNPKPNSNPNLTPKIYH